MSLQSQLYRNVLRSNPGTPWDKPAIAAKFVLERFCLQNGVDRLVALKIAEEVFQVSLEVYDSGFEDGYKTCEALKRPINDL